MDSLLVEDNEFQEEGSELLEVVDSRKGTWKDEGSREDNLVAEDSMAIKKLSC